jgi:hypothetical protein
VAHWCFGEFSFSKPILFFSASRCGISTPFVFTSTTTDDKVTSCHCYYILSEFVGCFKKNRIADVIASNFAQSLLVNVDLAYISNTKNPHFKVSDEIRFEAQTSVLKNILIFLDKYNLTAAETLFEFLCQQKAEWPMVDMGKLFEEEYEEVNSNGDVSVSTLKNKVSQKISSHIKRLASEAYLEKFNEDKRGFVMGFLILFGTSRV